ncbi:MAG TPA: helix-turn-helix domain-containing protein [Candidatus Acidoferrales bacterium]|nr:helix-turn-helix domain-containing protein [Candidatus Acidoferrales bacterium]
MRRLIVEISSRAFSKLFPEKPLQKITSAEVLHFLRFGQKDVAMILRVEFNQPNITIEDIFRDDLIEAQLLDREKEGGRERYTYFIKVKPAQPIRGGPDLTVGGGYFSLPYEVRNRKIKITFLGSAKQVRALLKTVEGAGVRYRVVSLTDAKFSPHSPISRLTEKQRRAVMMAYTLGYYDVPKKITIAQLAERLGLAISTLDVHLRKAERRLMYHIMNES